MLLGPGGHVLGEVGLRAESVRILRINPRPISGSFTSGNLNIAYPFLRVVLHTLDEG